MACLCLVQSDVIFRPMKRVQNPNMSWDRLKCISKDCHNLRLGRILTAHNHQTLAVVSFAMGLPRSAALPLPRCDQHSHLHLAASNRRSRRSRCATISSAMHPELLALLAVIGKAGPTLLAPLPVHVLCATQMAASLPRSAPPTAGNATSDADISTSGHTPCHESDERSHFRSRAVPVEAL